MLFRLYSFFSKSYYMGTVFILVTHALYSQHLDISVESGLGYYRMADLKQLNLNNLNSLSFEARQLDDYPSYSYYQPSLLFSFKKLLAVGVTFAHESTGSRTSRSDYSGEYHFDTRIRAFSPGAIIELYRPVNKLRLSFRNEAGLEYSRLRINEFLRISMNSQELDYEFTSKNIFYEPSVSLSCPVWLFRAAISAGYHLELKKGILRSTDSNDYVINLSNGEKARADWSGLRIGLSASFDFLQFRRSKHNMPDGLFENDL